jgi:hypothetical protein
MNRLRPRHLGLLIVVIAAYSFALVFSTAMVTLAVRPKPIFKIVPIITATPDAAPSPESFDPAYYGLPDAIAGYKIIAVETSANFACMTPGNIKLILQTSQPSIDTFLKNNPGGGVQSELEKLSLKPKQWELEYVGTGITKATVLSIAKQWDPRNHTICMILGGPITTLTPTHP